MFLKNDDEKTLDMDEIYLRRTKFIVTGKEVKEDPTLVSEPQSLYEILKNLISGQVFEIVFKLNNGYFASYQEMLDKKMVAQSNAINLGISHQNRSKRFMVQIDKNYTKINGIIYAATFFKDITFSVLYEQMRAQDQFKKLFTDTL